MPLWDEYVSKYDGTNHPVDKTFTIMVRGPQGVVGITLEELFEKVLASWSNALVIGAAVSIQGILTAKGGLTVLNLSIPPSPIFNVDVHGDMTARDISCRNISVGGQVTAQGMIQGNPNVYYQLYVDPADGFRIKQSQG